MYRHFFSRSLANFLNSPYQSVVEIRPFEIDKVEKEKYLNGIGDYLEARAQIRSNISSFHSSHLSFVEEMTAISSEIYNY